MGLKPQFEMVIHSAFLAAISYTRRSMLEERCWGWSSPVAELGR
jgi:hypothetical protein